jgi:hypothetical protein
VNLWLVPFFAQGLAMFIDEVWFHHRRGLPRWERIGHPVDTLSVLVPFVLLCGSRPETPHVLPIFCALAVVSSLCITKDEWVHKTLSTGGEQWLHSVLFLLHPAIFVAAWQLWRAGDRVALYAQTALICAWGLYQLVYWNVIRPRES